MQQLRTGGQKKMSVNPLLRIFLALNRDEMSVFVFCISINWMGMSFVGGEGGGRCDYLEDK